MEISLHPGNGDVQVAIFLRVFYHLSILVGVRRKQTHVPFLAYRPIPADKLVASRGSCPSNALTLVSFHVMLVPVLLACILVRGRVVFAAKNQCPGDASTRIIIRGGVVSRFVGTSCHAVNIRARSPATRAYVALVKFEWIVVATVAT